MHETISGKEIDIYSKGFNWTFRPVVNFIFKVDFVIVYFIKYFCRLVERINWFDLHLDM